ncbi:SRPBCC family protein [Yeosuana marina]|uniref:SRPBCC family protein n=1 Tax=Yeosuana marina TaxID=1565536 RepID=UPI0030EEAAE0|tara:strand:+ start:2973 stop:3410 length:438 start_codon:yes stop_codon:yes gene_type:complete
MNISVNENAPVKSTGKIEIHAPIDKVWQILTSINDWPSWQSEVTQSNLKENLKQGAIFKWKAGGLSFTSQIHTVEPKTKFGWTGKTFGASAIHNWSFSFENGNTVIKVEESLQGVFPKLFKNYFQKNLDKGIQLNLEDLKCASEK